MDLCKTCIFIEVNRDKECYWCILRNLELTNYYNIEACDDCIIEIKEILFGIVQPRTVDGSFGDNTIITR